MAIYHHSTKLIKRGDGKSAVAAAAYRSGEKIFDKRGGIVHDYTKKLGVEHTEIIAPIELSGDNVWIEDRAQLWNKIEAIEKRYDAQLAREIDIAIPVELDRQQRIDLVREYVKTSYVDRGMVADICFHDFQSNNPHAHVMLTMRELTIDDNGIATFGNKNRTWNDRELLMTHRREWAELANQHLERAGFDVRIDHRSNAEREIATVPQIHLGVHCAAMRSKGIATDRSDLYDQIEKTNTGIRQQLEDLYHAESDLKIAIAELEIERAAKEKNHQERIYRAALGAGKISKDFQSDPLYLEALEWQVGQDTEVTHPEIEKIATVTELEIVTSLDPFWEVDLESEPIKKWQPAMAQLTSTELLDRLGRLGQFERVELDDFKLTCQEGSIKIEHLNKKGEFESVLTLDLERQLSMLAPKENYDLVIGNYERMLGRAIESRLQQPAPELEIEEPGLVRAELDPILDFSIHYPTAGELRRAYELQSKGGNDQKRELVKELGNRLRDVWREQSNDRDGLPPPNYYHHSVDLKIEEWENLSQPERRQPDRSMQNRNLQRQIGYDFGR